ncbi:DNA internalization-related competence protein ComEC/Rec2 [Alteromonas sp. BL110]|nr:DNA internalization-related competence protein ComEC/Rec2 [Alteromonas sp. BL110]RKM79661.1 DNA internalization-related competence protein ComEC/Rec2 [Alteromonas sp. BL110]
MALMIAILVIAIVVILLFSLAKLTSNQSILEVQLCCAVSGLLLGVLWVASVGHFYYAWQLPDGKIQQDATITGQVLSGGCVPEKIRNAETAFHYVVSIATVNDESVATFLDEGIVSPSLNVFLSNAFRFKARLGHKQYKFSYDKAERRLPTLRGLEDIKRDSTSQTSEKSVELKCLHNGDTFTAVVKLKPAYGTANPVGASRQQQLVSQFIHVTGYIKSIEHDKTTHSHSLRYALATSLEGLNLKHLTWWRALLLGDKAGFTKDNWALLQRTGTGHIFSISGMHLSLIAGVCLLAFNPIIFILRQVFDIYGNVQYFLASIKSPRLSTGSGESKTNRRSSLLMTRAPIRTTVLCLLVVICFYYALLSGSALPVVRAWVLVAIGCVLSLSRNAWRPINIALAMLTLSLLLFPLSMLSASFYLSVGAVVGIWFLVTAWGLQRTSWHVSLIKLQIALTLIMMPLTLIWFDSASIIALIANLIALPVITLLLPVCLLSLLLLHFIHLGPVQQFASILFNTSDACLGYLLSTLNLLSRFSISAVNTHLGNGAMLCMLAALVIFLLPGWRYKKICILLLSIPFFSAIQKLLPVNDRPWTLHVFDAGQASAIAITKGSRAIIIDSGAQFSGIAHTATAHLLPFLESKQVSSIDIVIHTHSDNDHAGGLPAVKQHKLATQASFHSPTEGCERGKRIHWQNLTIDFLWPPKGNKKDNNAMSCVVKISSQAGSVLIPGDIEKASEYALITREINKSLEVGSALLSSFSNLRADILIAPHHGSKTSSTDIFIEHVAPEAVVFTQGFENRWQFPASEVATRYNYHGVKQYLTSYHGYIRATFTHGGYRIDTQRETLHKRWYLRRISPRHLEAQP